MLILLAALNALGSAGASVPEARPPVQIWMNNDHRFREGDRVRLQVDADVDGYLLVLNYDPDGRLRVLFPLDPRDDARVSAGRRYEVRDDSRDAAFRAGADGSGLIYSAISRDPWRFDDILRDGRWDYTRLSLDRNTDNPESDITELVQQLSGPGGFDYDVADYSVYGAAGYAYGDYSGRRPTYIYDDYLYCGDWYWRYNGCRRWPYDGGWSFGIGYYGYGSRPYGYGAYPYYYPYRPSFPVSGGRRPVIVGRPRNYTVFPRAGGGAGNFGGNRGSAGTIAAPPVNWRPRSVARPASGGGFDAARGSRDSRGVTPPARRAGGRPDAVGRGDPGTDHRAGGEVRPPARREGGEARSPERREPRAENPERREPRAESPARRAPSERSQPARAEGGNRGHGSGGSRGTPHSAPARSRRP